MSWSDLSVWLDLHYWFNSYPGPLTGIFLSAVYWVIAIFLLVGLISFIIKHFFIKDNLFRQIARRLSVLTVIMAVLLGIFLFFSQTQTPVLGSRFWLLLWLVGVLAWLVKFIYYSFKIVPEQRRWREERQQQVKYLSTTK